MKTVLLQSGKRFDKAEIIPELNLFIPLMLAKTLPELLQILRVRHKFLSKGTLFRQIIGAGQKRFYVKIYLPTEKAEKGGYYSAYVSSGRVGHEGGDLLVRKTVEEINKMF